MLQLMKQLLESNNNTLEAAMIMKMALKILWSCTQFSLPTSTVAGAAAEGGQGCGALTGWLEVILVILRKELPEASEGKEPLGQPTTVEERNAWPWWKLKKWSLQLLVRWFHRYGMPKYAADEDKPFAEAFSKVWAPALLEPIMTMLALRSQGRFCTDRCVQLSLTFMESSIQIGSTYKLLKPHMHFVMANVVFPLLCLTDDDLELFDTDPHEFVRKVSGWGVYCYDFLLLPA